MTKRGFWVARDLKDDRKLRGLKLAAGLLSVVALVAMFVTSVHRVPEPAWSVVMMVIAVALTALIACGVVHGQRRTMRRADTVRISWPHSLEALGGRSPR